MITIVGFQLERRFVTTTAISATTMVVVEEEEVAGLETKEVVTGNLNSWIIT